MKYIFTIVSLLVALRVSAQLSVGSGGMTILPGTSLTVDGLTLIPANTLTIANNSIQETATPLTGNPSINRLYRFGSPLLFSGKAGITYLTSELNGYTESTLQLAYAPAANTALTVTTSSTVNASTNYVANTVTNKNLFVVTATALSDLTPLLYARPSTVTSTTTVSVVVDVLELNNVATRGNFIVKITKDPNVTLTFSPRVTVVNGRTVQNSAWNFNASDEDYYILTPTQSIDASDQLSFGLTGTLTPGATTGVLTISSTVIDTGLIETKLSNNTDADKIDYFPK